MEDFFCFVFNLFTRGYYTMHELTLTPVIAGSRKEVKCSLLSSDLDTTTDRYTLGTFGAPLCRLLS